MLTMYGAYSPSHIYRPEDIIDIVHFATVRGVKVIPEFDAPAHVGSGWEWGPSRGLGDLALCINKEPWTKYCVEPPCGQLNPVNDNIYPILGNIYKDMSELFRSDIFHMGGDEVHMACWNETQEILTAPPASQEDVQKIQENNNNNQSENEAGSSGEDMTPPKNQGLIKARGTYFPLTAFPTSMPQGPIMRKDMMSENEESPVTGEFSLCFF